MGKRGPAPQPAALKKAKGTYQKCRDKTAEMPPSIPGAPAKPATLSTTASAIWDEVAAELVRIGTLSTCDGGTLEAYCRAVAQMREMDEAARETPFTETTWGIKEHPALKLMPKFLAQVERLAFVLGLHFVSRSRNAMPAKPPAEDAAEGFLFGEDGKPKLTAIPGGG